MNRDELIKLLDTYLQASLFQDYCPNGLQIEGKTEIKKIIFAVSATIESIDYAVAKKADALIVHHGLFWKHSGARPITNVLAKRIKPLIQNDINLIAYHLPLDAHAEVGNAATLGKKIGLGHLKPFGDYYRMPTGIHGELTEKQTPAQLQKKLEAVLNHSVIVSSPDMNKPIQTLGIITGGANNDWQKAADLRLDAFLTGEISEYNWHDAKEAGITFFAGGHNATEQFGIQALMSYLAVNADINGEFYSSANPA